MKWFRKLAKWAGGFTIVLVLAVGAYAAYASKTGLERLRFPDTPFPAVVASTDPAIIEQGRYLVYGPAHCAQCHTVTDREHPELLAEVHPLSGGFVFAMGPIGTTYAANLTPDVETGIGKRTDAELARAIRTGVLHDGSLSIFMRYSAANLSDPDLAAIISFLRSEPSVRNPVPVADWTILAKMMLPLMAMTPDLTPAPEAVPAPLEPTLERGEYLADHAMLCTACHTAIDPMTFALVGPKGGGSAPDPSHGSDSEKEFVAPNLTSDPTGITGRLDENAFLARIRHGRLHKSSTMPWENFARTTDTDLRSVYRYLRALPPVSNDVGPTYRDAGWVADGG